MDGPRPGSALDLDPALARRIAVDRQRFPARRRTATVAEMEAVIERLGAVQIDSVSAVDRAHRLTVATRVGRLPPDGFNVLRRRRRVFEYWAHEASLVPIADYRFYLRRMEQRRIHHWFGPVLNEHRELVERVLRDIEAGGPSSPRAYGGAGTGYWQWTPVKRVFEALWTAGELAVVERRGFERLFDLAERVIPAEHRGPAPTEEERLRHLVLRTVRARGVVTTARVGDYFRLKGGQKRVAGVIRDLVDEGALLAARVGRHEAVLDPEVEPLLADPPQPTAAILLCPFDNLIWDREETRRLFGFSHALEIYKRPHERRFGYYVLPLLAGDRLVGRIDCKADRAAGVLLAPAVHWERRPAWGALERALERLAHALGLEPGPLPRTTTPTRAGGGREARA